MRFSVGAVVLSLGLLLSHTAAARTWRTAAPNTMFPVLAAPSAAPSTVTVNATSSDNSGSTNKPIATNPTAGGGNAATGVAVGSSGSTVAYYEGESCDADIFSSGDDDDGEGGCGGGGESGGGSNVIVTPPPADPDPSKGDDDDDNKKKTDDDDDDKKETPSTSSSSSSSGSTDNGEKTLDLTPDPTPTLHGTHAQNVPHHRSSSPVSRFALIGVAIAIPLRRRRWKQ